MNKKWILTISLSVVLVVATLVIFQTKVLSSHAQQNGPVIQFENKTHDFGKIVEGEMAEHVFKFTNTGSDSLKISHVQASCGCTAALLSSMAVAPGESGEIKATFNSKGRVGKARKTITVTSNSVVSPQTILTFMVEVEPADGKKTDTASQK
ncbi:DUF1573 domain-containing protein [bacterium]|nr:DUF1573 domain-containing protein [bacterium]